MREAVSLRQHGDAIPSARPALVVRSDLHTRSGSFLGFARSLHLSVCPNAASSAEFFMAAERLLRHARPRPGYRRVLFAIALFEENARLPCCLAHALLHQVTPPLALFCRRRALRWRPYRPGHMGGPLPNPRPRTDILGSPHPPCTPPHPTAALCTIGRRRRRSGVLL